MEKYFTVEEIAQYLNYAEKTIRKWVLNQEIPYIKIHQTIRFRLSDIEKWVEANKVRSLSCKIEEKAGELFSDTEAVEQTEAIEIVEQENEEVT